MQVLAVDDEVLIGLAIEDALTEVGFDVTSCVDAREAMSHLDASADDLSCLVTDIRLPDGSGWEIARAFRQKRPGAGVVYISGHAAREWAAEGVPNSEFVQKPFGPDTIQSAVAKASGRI
jgi:DNA-binding NtrC family response regulator